MFFNNSAEIEYKQPYSAVRAQLKNNKIDDGTLGNIIYRKINYAIMMNIMRKVPNLKQCLIDDFKNTLKDYPEEQDRVKSHYLKSIAIKRKSNLPKELSAKLLEASNEIETKYLLTH